MHAAPLFHLVDVFAVYAITLVGGRHVILPTFNPATTLLTIGVYTWARYLQISVINIVSQTVSLKPPTVLICATMYAM